MHDRIVSRRSDSAMRNQIEVRTIKEAYHPGMRIKLLSMDDAQAPPIGTKGTVKGVDDIGSIMVAWDNGSSLNVILGIDEIEVVEEKQ